jgi:hypothetical protein
MIGVMNKVFTFLIISSYGTSNEVQLAGRAKQPPTVSEVWWRESSREGTNASSPCWTERRLDGSGGSVL